MQIEITRKFRKQVEDCNNNQIKPKVLNIIGAVIASERMIEFSNLKILSGYKTATGLG